MRPAQLLGHCTDDHPARAALRDEMLQFVGSIPSSAGLDWVKDPDFLYFFEAPRLLAMRFALEAGNFGQGEADNVLDFGYLHGLIPEFLHRAYPRARFVVGDHPNSPLFQNPEYLEVIRGRDYVRLLPLDIAEAGTVRDSFDLIVLGEIIEHLDPTTVARVLEDLRPRLRPNGMLLVTTPNAVSLKNAVYGLAGQDAQHPPIPDRMMGFGHIHLWSYPLLKRTMEHCGWRPAHVCYFHGFEEWERAKASEHWGSLRWQLATRLLFMIATWVKRWRGFMVTSWGPHPTS